MKTVLLLLKISRPKFWLYVAGPYLMGYMLGIKTQSELINPLFLIYLCYFLVLANIFLYGINDYYDEETDKFNPRKKSEEYLVQSKEKKILKLVLAALSFVSLIFVFLQTSFLERMLFIIFVALSYLYSAPPIRFKARVLFDSLSNVLYIFPGLFGYALITHTLPDTILIGGFFAWATAMHLFSAVPDIAADQKAGLRTTAIFLGRPLALVVCSVLWFLFACIISSKLMPFGLILFVYPLLPIYVLMNKKADINRVYRWYPYLNGMLGFVFFWLIFLTKPYA